MSVGMSQHRVSGTGCAVSQICVGVVCADMAWHAISQAWGVAFLVVRRALCGG